MTLDFYSPEQELFLPLFKEKQIRVFVKRDDLIHPFISGNKWRKLKYALIDAKRNGQDTIVTFGGAWSNHLLATACAGATFGFETFGFVRGDRVSNPVLAMCKLYGMELEFVSRTEYKHKENLFLQRFEHSNKTLFIDEGGYGPQGMKGCSEIIAELKQNYDHIFCAAGTGTTLAGLAKGIADHQLDGTLLHGIPVLKGGEFIEEEMKNLNAPISQLILHTAYHFGGYAKTSPELFHFIQEFVSKTGIMIEPVYTGKLFYALQDLVQKDTFLADEKILILHTGGLTGFLGMYEQFV
ncbi:1-aminocyclopropane-1-carboxylate deaminase/D-cysteine desulfhydrase [Sphingobacterium pedocola]|uniref:1-aminocyclopropane-1-carboxylate deaminase n=1 Tax=Sphingobacterium pedocola TaxID=2082722 RepID=A0ABR9T6W7_9SPHI|nr:pyridoxal-phosphate dependent enzyme [Sphingobacterium pedocola]MBE8721073.1 1-aminocyclopropane-1-carboxylate deaminase [Sphingobacterium pedocola]